MVPFTMPNADLLAKAKANPKGLRFSEACALAESYGWMLARSTGGSHRVYKRPGAMGMIVVQEGENGKAKAYQIRQIVRLIEELREG